MLSIEKSLLQRKVHTCWPLRSPFMSSRHRRFALAKSTILVAARRALRFRTEIKLESINFDILNEREKLIAHM